MNHTKRFLVGTYLKSQYYPSSQANTIFLCRKKKHGGNYTKDDFANLYHSKKFESYGLRIDDDLCFQRIVKLLGQSTELKKNKYQQLVANFDVRLLGLLLVKKPLKEETKKSYLLSQLRTSVQKTNKYSKNLLKKKVKSKNDPDTSDSGESSESESESSGDEN